MWRVVLPLCAVLVAGCSGEEAGGPAPTPEPTRSSTPAEPDAATVAWIDGVCAVEAALLENPPPPRLPEKPTEANRPAAVAFIAAAHKRFLAARTVLDGLGEAPAPEGEELVAAQREVVDELVGSLAEYLNHAKLFPAPEFAAPFRIAAVELVSYSTGHYVNELTEGNETLAKAYDSAPRC